MLLVPPPPQLLPSSRDSGALRRASVLLAAAVLLCVVPVSASYPAHSRCPLDCAKQRRHSCPLGSSYCGPCYRLFEEDEEGRCVLMRRHPHGRITSYADLDEEIDFLHSVIEKQQKSELKPPKKQPKKPVTISFQTELNKSETDASKRPEKTQSRLSDEALSTTTVAPLPAVSSLHSIPTPQPRVTNRAGPIAVPTSKKDNILVIMVSLCVVVGSAAVLLATVCFVKLQKESRLAEKVDYPAFKGAGLPAATANGTSAGDKTLAQSAQMYHYQHQKQQMRSMGNNKPEQKAHDTDVTSDEEEVEGDFTVYECPGLAPTGEMEVKNPLFDDSALSYQGNHK